MESLATLCDFGPVLARSHFPLGRLAPFLGIALMAVAVLCVAGPSTAAAFSCAGASIAGEGAEAQEDPQELWTSAFNSSCPEKVAYTASEAETSLTQWDSGGTKGSINHKLQFLGTNSAPNATEIANIKAAAGAGVHVQVIPVGQESIAIVVHPPSGCTMTKISDDLLEKAFEGAITEWSDFSGLFTEHSAGDCRRPVTRIAPAGNSQLTLLFKHYLGMIKGGVLDCTTKTWEQLRVGLDNQTWPEDCANQTLSTTERPFAAFGGVAATVAGMAGTIGFAPLADAKKAGAATLEVENGEKSFASPAAASGEKANCGETMYTVPSQARETGSGEDVNWSEVFGMALETPSYPICFLTFDLAFRDYSNAGFGAGFATTVKEYLREYVLEASGQGELEKSWYAKLPSTGAAAVNVLKAAKYAAGKIEE